MSVSDPIADMLTKIRNACMAGKESVDIPFSGIKLEIVKILKREGYIDSYSKTDKGELSLLLKYDGEEAPVIHGLRRLSKSGRRQYAGYREMPRVFNGYGTLIVSTSRGVVTGREAALNKAGGELLCSVW